ncbi:glycosyltransferase [Clostridium perfringens]|uniref:glycosyltransferase family 2 protein n=1 Tax=Clostridium perfringens TaxID=1502 RepID=UPI0022E0F269|nr:glycosyltransferase family 2 protein [Clostridium perfringens]MDK0703833.1 glycosyltransferase family 2 protein [Clostridium perfringens]MDM0617943.1 glycosyltransferase family 2 protein [Clostridium perfringens]MDZ4973901.1 glycosyltransferase [Clostridium perfringens]
MSKLVSVIVPAYNSEKYLSACIESLLAQTYESIEIIIINDGSTDNTMSICDFYEKSKDITVIHKKIGGGCSSARNTGLSIAKGDYITFCDSDDYMKINQIEVLVDNLEKMGSDLSSCSFSNSQEGLSDINDYVEVEKIYKDNLFDFIMYDERCSGYLWNKLFKREIILKHNLKFNDSICFYEDLIFVLQYLSVIDQMSFVDYKFYYYRDNPNSIVRSDLSKFKLTALYGIDEVIGILKSEKCNDKLIKKVWNELMCLYSSYFWKLIFSRYPNKRDWIKKIKNGLKKHSGEYKFDDSWTIKKYSMFWLMKCFLFFI